MLPSINLESVAIPFLFSAMSVLGKLCTVEGNDEIVEAGLEPEAYQSLIKVLVVNDVQVIWIVGDVEYIDSLN